MKLKQIAIALSAVALSTSAVAANYNVDENQLSQQAAFEGHAAAPIVRLGDENQLSAKGAFESRAATPTVRFGDENSTSWLPTARK